MNGASAISHKTLTTCKRVHVSSVAQNRAGISRGSNVGLGATIDAALNNILQSCLTRDLSRRYASADQLMHDLEYYIYHSGYGPTNETLGKFIRELFGLTPPAVAATEAHGKTIILEETARMRGHNT